jgi:hypothetical protein
MRALIAFVGMGMLAVVAVALVVVQELIRLLPLILIVLVVVYLKRRWGNRHAASPASPQRRPAAYAGGSSLPTPIPGRRGGWVMVPVWMPAPSRSAAQVTAPRPVIDAEVISEDTGRHGR